MTFFRPIADATPDQPVSAAVKSAGLLFLLVLLFAIIAACASAAGPVNYHYWIHTQLGLNAQEETALEPIEARFARRRDELVGSIREANEELATALLSDKGATEHVRAAVQKIHRAQGELQQAVLDHVFEMQAVLTPEQYDRLISLTADALREGAESR